MLLLTVSVPTLPPADGEKDVWNDRVSAFVAHPAMAEFDEAFAFFNETMKAALPGADLTTTWTMVQDQAVCFPERLLTGGSRGLLMRWPS